MRICCSIIFFQWWFRYMSMRTKIYNVRLSIIRNNRLGHDNIKSVYFLCKTKDRFVFFMIIWQIFLISNKLNIVSFNHWHVWISQRVNIITFLLVAADFCSEDLLCRLAAIGFCNKKKTRIAGRRNRPFFRNSMSFLLIVMCHPCFYILRLI